MQPVPLLPIALISRSNAGLPKVLRVPNAKVANTKLANKKLANKKLVSAEFISWIAVDWGTTHLRVYAVSQDYQVIASTQSTKGMGVLSPNEFEPALLELIADWLPSHGSTPVLACGMVGARQGWQEAAYQVTPCRPLDSKYVLKATAKNRQMDLYILPGISQKRPADVMRGEETQVAGLLATTANAAEIICLPGTHSKWVKLAHEKVVQFSTFMTGEMFALICQHSVLRHNIDSNHWDDDAFLEGVVQASANPAQWLSHCFRLRANSLLNEPPIGTTRAQVSGLLIGCELSGAKHYWQGKTVALIGDESLSNLYSRAMRQLNIPTEKYHSTKMTLAGLTELHRILLTKEASQ